MKDNANIVRDISDQLSARLLLTVSRFPVGNGLSRLVQICSKFTLRYPQSFSVKFNLQLNVRDHHLLFNLNVAHN